MPNNKAKPEYNEYQVYFAIEDIEDTKTLSKS